MYFQREIHLSSWSWGQFEAASWGADCRGKQVRFLKPKTNLYTFCNAPKFPKNSENERRHITSSRERTKKLPILIRCANKK